MYYFGFQAYSAADQFNLYLDDVTINLVPNIDYAVSSVFQVDGIPTPFGIISNTSLVKGNETAEIKVDAVGVPSSNVNNSLVILNSKPDQFAGNSEGFTPVNMKAIVSNQGSSAFPFVLNYNYCRSSRYSD
jgi:hypothetical protein